MQASLLTINKLFTGKSSLDGDSKAERIGQAAKQQSHAARPHFTGKLEKFSCHGGGKSFVEN